MCSGVPLHVPQKFFWARGAVWKACQASVLWIRSVQRTQPCRYKVQWVRVIKPESHPLRHLQTPRYPMKCWKPLTWMVEGFFCVQRCLKNPFPRLYSRCILPYLDFLRPSYFSLCTPKTYLQRLFMIVLCNSLLLTLHLFNGKEQRLSHSSFFLRLYAVKERFYG